MSNRFFIIVIAVIVLFAGAFALTKHKSNSGTKGTTTVNPTNHTEGSTKSGVVLMEYGDYQCPACGQYYPILKQIYDKYQGQIIFQFRNFPLVQLHPNAFVAARVAEAADKQGKFWEMHDLLYENQQAWGPSSSPNTFFLGYAKQLGLDTVKFQQDMMAQATNDLINADIAEGQKLGANSTPTFAINGKKLETNPRSVDEFNKLIDDAIKQKATKQ